MPRSFGTSGKQQAVLKPGDEIEIYTHQGAGMLTHFWYAGDPRTLMRIYVDGEKRASVRFPLTFGHGFLSPEQSPAPWSSDNMGRLGAVFNNYRIPFAQSVRVTLESQVKQLDFVTKNEIWWSIRGLDRVSVELGGFRLPQQARLRTYHLEDHRARPPEEFTLVYTQRSGALYQVVLAAEPELSAIDDWRDWSYQEGMVRAYMGDSREPLLLSAGLEDYFLSSGYFHHATVYATPNAGLTHIDTETKSFVGYRVHDSDPVFFRNGLRLTLRCGELKENGAVYHVPTPARYSAIAWVYEW